MATKVWQNINGAPADYETIADWGGSLPASGDTALIGQGVVEITSSDTLPANLTFGVGYTQASVWVVPTSVLQVMDANLQTGVVIDNQSSGGTLVWGGNAAVIGSLLLATGSVTSSATINVGAGDFEDIAMMKDASNVPGSFDNLGTINVTGTATNYAGLAFLPATTGGAGASASYGAVHLTYGFMTALAPDSSGGPAGQITLNNGSVAILAADLRNTNVTFNDATDRLDIGQNPSGFPNGTGTGAEYAFGGTITGFQSGDAIGLMENGSGATPASLGYNASTGMLTIYSGPNHTGFVLGALNIPGVNPNDSFVLVQQPSGPDYTGYTSQYEIALADVWNGANPGDFNTAANWQGGVAPVAGGVAKIGTGKATLSSGETLAPMTIVLGALASNLSTSATSNLAITNDSLGAGETIDVTGLGGAINAALTGPAILAGIGATGGVNFAGTINVGAGDALSVGIAASASINPGAFDNTGTINVTGTSSNYAFMQVKPGNQGSGSAVGAYADYGAVNLSDAIFLAKASDSGPASPSDTGTFNLSNGSVLGVVSNTIQGVTTDPVLSATVVNFKDSTGALLIGQANGGFNEGGASTGAINGFQVGDVIGLLSTGAVPSYLSYDSSTGQLSLFDASNTQIGQLHLVGNFTTADFSIGLTGSSPVSGYTNEYQIKLNPVWLSGVTGHINDPTKWTNGVTPNFGGTAVLQAGTIQIGSSDYVPTPLTLDVGTAVDHVGATSQSNVEVTQTFLPSQLTIDNVASGGSIVSPADNAPIESALGANGFVTSDATINVGAGDAELIGVSALSSTSGSAWFDNEGAINLDGAAGNYAVALFNSYGPNSSANSVFYGAIDLNYGFLYAGVSDTPMPGATPGPTTISLGNSSDFVAAAALSIANVRFVDATTGDRFDLAPQTSGNTYQFGGAIYNFRPGDVIALQETATPAAPISVTYDTGTQILTIWQDAAQIGSLQIVGNYGANSFSGTQQSSSTLSALGNGFTSEYDIKVSPQPYTWVGGTADYYTSDGWTGTTSFPPNGESPANPTVATIVEGTVEIGAADPAPSNVTFDVGALTLGISPNSIPASVLALTDVSLDSSVTIDNTAAGGDFPSSGSPNVFLSGLDTYGQVNFAGTINVGAGDAEFVTIAPDPSDTTTPGYFDNSGVINVTGTPGNQAAVLVTTDGSKAGGYADYGTVNLSNGLFYAEAPDSGPGATNGGVFNLANGSQLAVFNAIFTQTTVHFADATDTLILGPDPSNQYEFGGTGGEITGLRAGDTIALEENGSAALPASLSYSSGVLSVFDASATPVLIGQIDISDPSNLFATANFIGIQTYASINNFTGEYDIRVADALNSLDVPVGTTTDIGQSSTSGWQPGFLNVVTTATVEGALNVDSAPTATGGSLLNVGDALAVNSTGVLTIGSGSSLNAQTSVIAGSLTNTGQILLSGNDSNYNGLASLTVHSAAGMGGQAGVLTGGVSLSGAAELDFASGGLTTITSGGDLTMSGSQASIDIGSNQGGDTALSGLAAIDAGGALDLENGSFLSINGALDNSGVIDLGASSAGFGVSLHISGALTNSGTITLGSTSDYLSVGSLNNAVGGVLDLENGASLSINNNLNNSGVIDLATSGSSSSAWLQISGAPTNNSGATIDANKTGQSLSLFSNLSLVNNGVLEADGGTLIVSAGLGAAITGAGSAIVTHGGTLNFNYSFNQNVAFQGAGALNLSQSSYSGVISGFGVNGAAGNSIDLNNLAYDSGWQANLNATTDVVTITEHSQTFTLQFDASVSGETFSLASANNGGGTLITAQSPLCFMAGTMIRTPDGEVAVETLKRGDLVLTWDGLAQPVRWLGRQTISTRFADPVRVLPIRIRAGALAENVPARDLRLSPDHAVLVDGALIHAGALVNGASILRETAAPEIFTYYHVELDDHSLVLAENTPAETFVDNVERLAFDNWAEHEALYPEGKPIDEMPYPRAKARRQVPLPTRAALDERANVLGAKGILAVA
jgi:hypothetical protein